LDRAEHSGGAVGFRGWGLGAWVRGFLEANGEDSEAVLGEGEVMDAHLSIYLSIYLYLSISISIYTYLSVYLSIYLSMSIFLSLSVCLSIYILPGSQRREQRGGAW
jgi:hypothetical protein